MSNEKDSSSLLPYVEAYNGITDDNYKSIIEALDICHSIDDFTNINERIFIQDLAPIGQNTEDPALINCNIEDQEPLDRNAEEPTLTNCNRQESENIEQKLSLITIITDQDITSPHLCNRFSCLSDEANSTITTSFNVFECVKMKPSGNGHLPDDILKLFSDRSKQEVGNIMKKVQDEIDKIWAKIDKQYEKCVMTKSIISKIEKDFPKALKAYLLKEFGTQVDLVNDARLMLEQLSFGGIFCNTKNEACAWIKIDDVIRNKPEGNHDIYYTLRPFVRYLKDHPMP
ncbi:unnamed protein product [Rotaria sordida]|uniref:Uncharacterized protein n=1 Tax=Rotaria sordida TaxID=392033 RepID=A0A815RGB0_9BILA|nr:unnamed protein product [Rotaria sordida]